MMINDLETSLNNWCKTRDDKTFDIIYQPMKYMASSICAKYKIKKDLDETINDMVAHASITFPEKFDANRGKAKSMLYIIMSSYLLNKMRTDNRKKRKNIVYIEDLETCNDQIAVVIEISIDNIDDLKDTLLKNRRLFDNINDKMQKKIKDAVLECIEFPEKYECNYNSYTSDIAKKCKTKVYNVYETLKVMCSNIQTSGI